MPVMYDFAMLKPPISFWRTTPCSQGVCWFLAGVGLGQLALVERVPFNTFAAYVAVAPGALHVSRFFTVEAWAGFGGSTIEVGANFIAHNGKSYTREHTTPYYRAEYIVR